MSSGYEILCTRQFGEQLTKVPKRIQENFRASTITSLANLTEASCNTDDSTCIGVGMATTEWSTGYGAAQ